MISTDEDALICDFAEYYHIYDFESLGTIKASILAFGLPDSSRIKRKLTGQKASNETLLMALIVDDLNLMLWQRGAKNTAKPKSVYQALIGKEEKNNEQVKGFNSADDFEEARRKILAEKTANKVAEKGEVIWQKDTNLPKPMSKLFPLQKI